MSWFETESFTCTDCRRPFDAPTAETINVGRMPHAREQILSGTFHRVTCPQCGVRIEIDRTFLYTDPGRRHFAQVFPKNHVREWPEWEQMADEVFHQGFYTGPAGVQPLGAGFKVRAVFGLDELAEKLRIWDSQLDDALVEVLKVELVTTWPDLLRHGDPWLTVVSIGDRSIEVQARSDVSEGEAHMYGMSLGRYRELETRRSELEQQLPGLFFKPFVSYRRVAREEVER
jgi:hypothetical protein